MRISKIIVLTLASSMLLTSCSIFKSTAVDCSKLPTKEIQFWSTRDDSQVWEPIIAAYQNTLNCAQLGNTNYKIVYTKLDPAEYEDRVLRDTAAGRGPDIVTLHNTWLPKYADILSPYPLADISFLGNFVDVVKTDGVLNGKLYALPLSVDTLGLYYNADKFNAANIINPPSTWQEFDADLQKLTAYNPDGSIKRSGAAIGSSENINRGVDIVETLMMQSGIKMTSDDHTQATFAGDQANAVMNKYISYADRTNSSYTWDPNGEYSIDAFVNEHTAMMFNYSYQAATIRAKNVNLNFKVAQLPQIDSNGNNRLTIANYQMYGVTTQAAQDPIKARIAWDFLHLVTGGDASNRTLTKMYLDATGKPTALRDLVNSQINSPNIGAFVSQALVAKSWTEVDQSKIDVIFNDGITSVIKGTASVDRAVRTMQDRVTQLLQTYVKKPTT